MNCISFPKIFSGNATKVLKDGIDSNSATLTCMHLLLSSEEGSFLYDPEFGLRIRKFFFDQNNYILRGILIDEIYTKLISFCPQIYVDRKNIEITSSKTSLFTKIICKNRETFQTNMFNLKIFEAEASE